MRDGNQPPPTKIHPMIVLLIASNNAHKHQELREIFAMHGLGPNEVRLLMPKEIGIDIDPEENADTYVGNALIKARAFAQYSGAHGQDSLREAWVLADDSGLEVDALDGRPGLRSARYHKAAPGGDGCAALLKEMQGIPEPQRNARFRAVLAAIDPQGREHVFDGVCEGAIGSEKRGIGGFGFDPVFRVVGDPQGRHMAELLSEEKHRISHRGLATRQFISHLRDITI